MQTAQEIYSVSVSHWSSTEQLQLAWLILNGITQEPLVQTNKVPRRSMREIMNELPGGRIFKTAEEADAYLREERDSWER